MATTREIRDRINSIGDTLKITNAMYLISSTKLRKAKKALLDTEPYFYSIQSLMARLIRHLPEGFSHPYLDFRTDIEKSQLRRGYIAVTADKGLAGAYNHNVLKLVEEKLAEHSNNMLFVVGEVGRQYFEQRGIPIDEQFHYTAQNPSLHRSRMITARMLDLYFRREIDEVYIVYTRMKNSLQMETEIVQLLPLNKLNRETFDKAVSAGVTQQDFRMEPSPKAVIDNIVPNYLDGFIYGALVESFCCEQNARMMAMDAANKNGQQMKHDLSVEYNRVRQGQITQEITEICAGARAQRSGQGS
ncbi:MAG: ATP synthase F1 subunit gamma [Eubacteriales bacterium]|nr:ATP synthase F1 subunit gamma [Eubacteriales bacterium]